MREVEVGDCEMVLLEGLEVYCEDGFGAKAEEGECVGFGCTAPSLRSEAAKSGSEASRFIAGRE